MTSQLFSISDIEVLMHYGCSPTKHPRFDAPAVQNSIARWVKEECIAWDDEASTYITTPRGDAHIKQLKRIQPPILAEVWVNPATMEVL